MNIRRKELTKDEKEIADSFAHGKFKKKKDSRDFTKMARDTKEAFINMCLEENVMNKRLTPEKIERLEPNEVFVFGSNMTGFHGAGASGFACRGDSRNTWRQDLWFLKAIKSSVNSDDRIGKWAIYGQAKGYQKGKQGQSYAIITITKPGQKRSVSFHFILKQLIELNTFAKSHTELVFLTTKIGCELAGFTTNEIKGLFMQIEDLSENIVLPKEFEFRF